MKRRVRHKNFLRKGLTLLEMVIALAMIIVISSAILPQLKVSNDGWAVILNVDAVADPSSGDAIMP